MRTFSNDVISLKRFTKSDILTINDIRNYFAPNSTLSSYLPDDPDFKRIPRSLLFTIIFKIDQNLYKKLVIQEKEESEKVKLKSFGKFYIEVVDEFAEAITQTSELKSKTSFNRIVYESKQNKKFIRLSKRRTILQELKKEVIS